jgi:hypothetical protein
VLNVFCNYWDNFSRIKGHEFNDDNSPSLNADVWNAWNFLPTHYFLHYYVRVGTGACVRQAWPADYRQGLPVLCHLDQRSVKLWIKAWRRTSSIASCQLTSHIQLPQTSYACILFASQRGEKSFMFPCPWNMSIRKERCYWRVLGYIWSDFQKYTVLIYEAIKLQMTVNFRYKDYPMISYIDLSFYLCK